VLVIDDDATVRDLMARFLDKEGFFVQTAASGEEGLQKARELQPDAITLDVMMPRMDGWAVLSALKAEPALADIPVIMLTLIDERSIGYALGATEYLTKPVDHTRLTAILRRYPRRTAGAVLVVEDDPLTRQMMRRLLEKAGWDVTEAENGRAALERIEEACPALILLDLMMPEMDGFTFLEALRKHQKCRSVPVVVITAKELTPEDNRRLNGYVERVLQKGSYRREELLEMLRDRVAAYAAQGLAVGAEEKGRA
jgi:CheY-like chemotaxis protein